MAGSFFGFDTSLSNLNDDDEGGEPSEDEYDALNDETFGQDGEDFDWEVEHELGVEQLEISRRHNSSIDESANSQLEASLSQLVLDETDALHSHSTLGSSVWRHDLSVFPTAPTSVPPLKTVHTVEELERQLRQKQMPHQQSFSNQNYFQPRFPVILQRPPGLQAPVPLPFAPQQSINHNMTQMNQPLSNIVGQNNQMVPNNQCNQLGQTNQLMTNPMGQNVNHLNQNLNQFMQNHQVSNQFPNQLGQNMNQMQQNLNPMGPNQILQNQMSANITQLGQNVNNQMNKNFNHIGQNVNQLSQNMNQLGQNVNQLNHNMNQMMPNGNQFSQNMNQFPHVMGQQRILAPPPGMNMPRQNFTPNMGQYNSPGPQFRNQLPTKQNVDQQPTMNHQPNAFNQQMLPQQQLKSPQMKQATDQSPSNNLQNKNNLQNRGDSKVQKSRVYNNSSQKNMTSQNLVQLIQNTHPMLQFNNSFHNASHHPMLNNRNNTFNNNQFGNNHLMFNNQRHNGQYNNNHNNNRQLTNGDESSVSSDTDEYAGMMTPREKQWLINIQILQLNTGTPYIHDFYYTVFLERQSRKEKESIKEAHKANQQNHPFYSGVKEERIQHGRERHNSTRHNSTSEDPVPRTYVPTQFENSLGKLQCGSVTAPRKIIDVEVVAGEPASARASRAPSVASTTNPAEVPREMKRTKQILLDIEALYLILLRIEELNDPLAISNALILKEREEKQKQLEAIQKEALENEQEEESNVFLRNIESVQRRPKQDSPKTETVDKRQVVNLAVAQKPPVKNLLDEDKDDLINKMFVGLLHSDRLALMLNVRKGRSLISRFVCRVPATHARLRALWARVLRALPSAARRDDGSLAPLAAHYNKYIQNTNGWSAILESCSLLSEALDPARTPHALTSSLTLSCVCSLIEKAFSLVNTPEATSNERQWSKFLKTLARALKNTTLNVARPVQPLLESKLMYHIKQLESRSTIEILQRGRTTAEFADLSKNDLSEQLIKHLC